MALAIKKPAFFKGSQTLSASGTGNIPITIPAEYNFDFTAFSYHAESAAANIVPHFSFQIVVGNDNLFSDYLPSDLFSGFRINTNASPNNLYEVGQSLWHKMDIPYTVMAKSQINILLRNDVAQIITVQFAVKGVRVYA